MASVSTDDWVGVSDFLGRYCWLVDDGRADEWLALWAPDGVFAGFGPDPIVGHEQLRAIPTDAFRDYGGQMRHLVGNLSCSYGDDRDTVKARFYNYVTVWGGQPAAGHFVMAICEMTLMRTGDSWKIKRNDVRLLMP